MCGEVPRGCYTIDVAVHLTANQTNLVVPLPRKLEHVEQIWLTEYQLVAAGGVGLYRLDLKNMLKHTQVSNAAGDGFCFAVDNTTVAHTVYTKPRTMTVDGQMQVLELNLTVRDVSTGAIVVPTYTNATFFLTFICRQPGWDPDQRIRDTVLDNPLAAQRQFSTRAPFI